ncbi:MAG TPA: hypothetical protein PLH84_08875 [Candidatus Krumholzibacteria bacterium]|nr:hypothetical protein [Candidatus Krumholzibacteria bacterium]
MNVRLRLPAVLLTLLLTAAVALPSGECPPSADPAPLLPADQTVTVAVSSLDDLAAAWTRLAAALDLDDDTDLHAMMREHAPAMAQVFDPARTMTFSFLVHPIMFQQEPDWTHVLPVRGNVTDPTALLDGNDVAGWLLRDGQLAVSSQAEIALAEPAPAWWLDMLPGVVAAHADLTALIEQNRGMVEMSLASMPMMAEQARQQAEAGEEPATPMEMPSAEQMEGIAKVMRMVMDSLAAMDAAADVTRDAAVLRTRFDVNPDTPLALGPQPAFAAALDLTRRLPRHADILGAGAFDQSRALAAMDDYLRASLRDTYGELIADPDLVEHWVDAYMEFAGTTNRPWAMSMGRADAGFTFRWAQQADEAEELLALVAQLMDLSRGMEVAKVTPLATERLAGTDVMVWSVDYALPAHMVQDADPEQMRILQTVMEAFVGEIRVAARDGLLLMSMNEGPEGMTEMLVGGGRPSDRLAALAAQGGPDVRQVVSGNYGAFLDLIAQAAGVEAAAGAVPFTAVTTGAGTRGGAEISVALEGLERLMAFFQTMDASR